MAENVVLFLLLGLGLLAVLSVHEVGHLLVARYYGIKVLSLSVGFGPSLLNFTDSLGTSWKLRVLPLGGSCVLDDQFYRKKPQLDTQVEPKSLPNYLQRALVYAAGPIANIIFSASLSFVASTMCSTCALNSSQMESMGVTSVRLIAELSGAIALFNLLPILPLDGGRLCMAAIEAGSCRPISPTTEKRFFLLSAVALTGITLAYAIPMLPLLRHENASFIRNHVVATPTPSGQDFQTPTLSVPNEIR
jgi:membrane-associated protease RseP (regulator of RpoE activity)